MQQLLVYKYSNAEKGEDGYWHADAERKELILMLDEITPKTICTQLKQAGYLESANMRILYVTDTDKDIISVCKKKDKVPLYRLEKFL